MTELERAVRHSMPSPAVLILNYPSNPTGQVMDLSFFEEVVAFARAHGLFILSDLAYAEIYFDGEPPPSGLQVLGAKDLAVEFTSMSKTYSMAGCAGGELRPSRVAHSGTARYHVRMGSLATRLRGDGVDEVQQTAPRAREGRRVSGHRVLGVRRGIPTYRARREHTADKAGGA